MIRWLAIFGLVLLAGCGSTPPAPTPGPAIGDSEKRPIAKAPTPTKKPTAVLKRGGGFYKDDGPADDIPDGLEDIPDAEPKWEPLHKPATKPYTVLGKEYVPNNSVKPYKVRGIASWYGKKFHGQKTSIGEPYDMFAMTAAHPTLALPSYVRVTSVQSGKSVIVRITDRGPFHADRVIDLSYTAAYKLGLINGGSGQVEVEAIVPGEATGTTYAQVSPARPSSSDSDQIEQLSRRMALEEKVPQPAPASPPAQTGSIKGIYLQLGAFASADNAENLKSHLMRELDWLTENMQVNPGGGMHRLQLGPYASRSDADRVAEKIRAALGYRPTVVNR
ncbi:septal ring lytic transglycosylase RlpA family protein [Dechloromonas sp. HYN0024]|uniref:septal ring lytic transglycosylase RlpA family protein n=1 Tax=Dechloromonas sp. HYN0024 TaxID=2231055 RepID=UPI000E448298|nr:septal ring lytic transglycosylase RlpA family protein [Dechloromonas sp. HYN0024]AXS78663.1 septal ring lytic transglycosylase RlpA family protein [Dechloromonas sp. HYN0024]